MARKSRKGSNGNSGSKANFKESSGTFNNTQGVLFDDFANLNYSFKPGTKIFKQFDKTLGNADSLPAVMSFDVIPTVGSNEENTDPINLAANLIYKKVRSVNSGAKNYDANNLMIYILSMDSIYSFHAWITRLYGMLSQYSRDNYYMPDVFVKAMGFEPSDIRAHMLDLKGYIDLFAARANTLAIPNVVPLIMNHTRMYANMYSDTNSILGQMFLFNPAGFYRYEENPASGTNVGTLVFHDKQRTSLWGFDDIVSMADTLLNDLMESEDILVMSGDILKAYSDAGILQLPAIDFNYTTEIVYDKDVLTAIHNADTIRRSGSDISEDVLVGNIEWDGATSRIKQRIALNASGTKSYNVNSKKFIDQHIDKPTIQDNINACRFKFTIKTNTDDQTKEQYAFAIDACGPELLCDPTIWVGDTQASYFSTYGLFDTTKTGMNIFTSYLMFDMAPIIIKNVVGSGGSVPFLFGEIYNPTLVDDVTLKNMMLAYFMSEFGIQ